MSGVGKGGAKRAQMAPQAAPGPSGGDLGPFPVRGAHLRAKKRDFSFTVISDAILA